MELSPRLRAVADWVPQGARLVDVGTDHGFLPVWLLQKKRVNVVIASDLRQAPLNKAKATAHRYKMEETIQFRLCNGLADISPEEVDTITLCGMGGDTIASILGGAKWTSQGKHTFLLQPMSSLPELRLWLSNNGFRIQREQMICEGKELYNAFLVVAGKMSPLTPGEVWAGKQDSGMDWALRMRLLELLCKRAARALDGLKRSTRPEDMGKLQEFEQLFHELEQMKKEWETWQQ